MYVYTFEIVYASGKRRNDPGIESERWNTNINYRLDRIKTAHKKQTLYYCIFMRNAEYKLYDIASLGWLTGMRRDTPKTNKIRVFVAEHRSS